MNNDPRTFKPAPEPQQEPQPEEQPAPDPRPRRKRLVQPVFRFRVSRPAHAMRIMAAALVVVMTLGAQAQGDPAPQQPPPTKPQVPGQPRPTASTGWVLFNGKIAQDLNIPEDKLQQLRDVDAKYQKDYAALGNEPTRNPGYADLTARRDADIKALLSTDEYARWNARFHSSPPAPEPMKKTIP
jgi:hypothetical protein